MYKPDMALAPGGLGGLVPGGLGGVAPIQNPLQSKIAKLFSAGGLSMSKAALVGLTAFPSTGYVGVNLFAVNQTISGSLKALVYLLGLLLSFYTQKYMSNIPAQVVKWILLFAPPWYVYDILQVTDKHFSGFKNPIRNVEPVKPTTGEWMLTPSIISLILGTLSASVAAAILNSPLTKMIFPQGITSQYISMGSYGGSSSLILIGLMGIFFSDSDSKTSVVAAAAPAAPAAPVAAPVAAPAAAAPVAAPVTAPDAAISNVMGALNQAGGGMSLPPLSSFLKYKQSTNIHESTTFLSILGIIFVGGILLSALRAKEAV